MLFFSFLDLWPFLAFCLLILVYYFRPFVQSRNDLGTS
jgi:hypothetical protein